MFDIDNITASYSTLVRQAPMTVMEYMRDLKQEMGEEWVKTNPQAFALLVQAAAIDMHGNTVGKELGKLTGAITSFMSRFDEAASE